MKEEELLRSITGTKPTPFRVPEGYFDTLTERITSSLPPIRRKRPTLRLWKYAAATLFLIAAGAALTLTTRKNAQTAQAEQAERQYLDDALDYAMITSDDIEFYLTEAQ